ncbi:hypothetical protein PNP59_04300 [Halobacterium salinarum]|uniref:hypothetical protein n=1 Tax=Halobacterium salinarum TaxID=2242 RepID=UPI002553E0CC|nr:hypothetical protein [Halobacterium salinarum]MDL0130159.1 hypothetical protein [Halobacterium salinarum]
MTTPSAQTRSPLDDVEKSLSNLRDHEILKTIPPETVLTVSWQPPSSDTPVTTTAEVTDTDSPSPLVTLAPESDETMLYATRPDDDSLYIKPATPTQAIDGGEICDVTVQSVPVKPLYITDGGVSTPDPFVGKTGYLNIESDTGDAHQKITDPGLEEYDQRLLVPLMPGNNPHELDGRELSVWLLGERRRWYRIVDDRNHSLDSYPLVDRPAYSAADLEENPYYERLETSWEIVQQLKSAVQDDPQFDDESENRIVKRLMNLESDLRGVQLRVDCPNPRSKQNVNPTLYHNPDWETYDEALSIIETRLTAVSDAHRNATTDTQQLTQIRLEVNRLKNAIEDLREYIATPTGKPTDTP